MPLSRLTQTLPLDFAAEAWASEAAPVGAALVEVFLSDAGEDDAGALAGALEDGFMEELLALAGALPEGFAMPESLAAVLLFRLLFEVVVAVSVLALPG